MAQESAGQSAGIESDDVVAAWIADLVAAGPAVLPPQVQALLRRGAARSRDRRAA